MPRNEAGCAQKARIKHVYSAFGSMHLLPAPRVSDIVHRGHHTFEHLGQRGGSQSGKGVVCPWTGEYVATTERVVPVASVLMGPLGGVGRRGWFYSQHMKSLAGFK